MQYYCSTYNLAGEKVSSFPYGGVVGTLSDVIHSRYMYSASNRSFDILDRYTEESTTIPCQGYIEMPVNGRTLCWGDNVLSLIDLNGSVIKERQLDVKHVYPTDTTRWILSLQNDYYAIVDETLEFLFEPIQKRITYVGENMFLIGADVTNANGEVLFSLPQYDEVISGLHEFYFYNGIAIVNLSDYYDQSAPLNCPYRYIRNDGEVLFNG